MHNSIWCDIARSTSWHLYSTKTKTDYLFFVHYLLRLLNAVCSKQGIYIITMNSMNMDELMHMLFLTYLVGFCLI